MIDVPLRVARRPRSAPPRPSGQAAFRGPARPRALLVAALLAGGATCGEPRVARRQQALGTFPIAADVGPVGATGGWTQAGGVHTVRGSGADVWETADELRFVHNRIVGDATLVARVASLENTNAWAKAGLMIREDLTPGARNAFVLATPTPANRYRFQARTSPGATTSSAASAATGTAPVWLRLQRQGTSFSAAHSADGQVWTPIGEPVTIAMGATVYVGLAVTSHADGAVAAATFDGVTIAGAEALPLYVEAESGVLAPPLQPFGDGAASAKNGVQVAPGHNSYAAPPTSGRASWGFSVGAAGTYRLFGRVIAETVEDDSFWVRVDGGTWIKWNNIPLGAAWHWAAVHDSDAGDAVVQIPLAAGSHTLELAYREDGAKLDRWFLTNDPGAQPSNEARPSVRFGYPADGSTNVPTTAFMSTDLVLPTSGGGVDGRTLGEQTVRLVRASDGAAVAATRNTSGGGDVVVLSPTEPLAPHTRYVFSVTEGLRDTSGAAFVPFSTTFETGAAAPPPNPDVGFVKVALPSTANRTYTSLALGPDGKLYAGTMSGEIVRFPLATDGVTGAAEVLPSVKLASGGAARAIIGLAFDPAAPAGELVLWITHGPAVLENAPDWSGKVSKLTGPDLEVVTDVVVDLPRSIRDHLTNSLAFNPAEPGVLYFPQGSMTAMGAPDNAWGNRAEHLLSGSVLRLDTAKLPAALPLVVRTNDADPGASGYDPFAPGAPLTIFASGVRNAYDLVWHSNGSLYVPTNGSAAGGATPATPAVLPAACARRLDGTPYTGPAVPGILGVFVPQSDFLFRVVQGGHYGHPNPFLCEWVLNGGNPTSATDRAQVAQYPVGTQPDRNWRGAAFDFGVHYSPNGVIEWKSAAVPALVGKLLVARYSGGDDLVALTLDPTTGDVAGVETRLAGLTGFDGPLDVVERVGPGHLYVSEHDGRRITLLRPR